MDVILFISKVNITRFVYHIECNRGNVRVSMLIILREGFLMVYSVHKDITHWSGELNAEGNLLSLLEVY